MTIPEAHQKILKRVSFLFLSDSAQRHKKMSLILLQKPLIGRFVRIHLTGEAFVPILF